MSARVHSVVGTSLLLLALSGCPDAEAPLPAPAIAGARALTRDASGHAIAVVDLATGATLTRLEVPAPDRLRPAVVDDTLFVPGDPRVENRLIALAIGERSVRWEKKFPDRVVGVAASTEAVFVVTHGFVHGEHLIALDPASGATRWEVSSDSFDAESILFAPGIVLVRSAGALEAYDTRDGFLRWRIAGAGATAVDGSAAYALVFKSHFLWVDRFLRASSLADGALRWSVKAPRSAFGIAAEGGLLAVFGEELQVLDAATGAKRWGAACDGAGAMNRAVVVCAEEHALKARDALSGRRLWEISLERAPKATPVIAGGAIVLRTGYDSLRAFEQSTGALRWDVPLGGDVVVASHGAGGAPAGVRTPDAGP